MMVVAFIMRDVYWTFCTHFVLQVTKACREGLGTEATLCVLCIFSSFYDNRQGNQLCCTSPPSSVLVNMETSFHVGLTHETLWVICGRLVEAFDCGVVNEPHLLLHE